MALALVGCTPDIDPPRDERSVPALPSVTPSAGGASAPPRTRGTVTLAFAGDVHFEGASRTTVAGTKVAVLAVDASPLESDASVWEVGRNGPGVARAGGRLVSAVRAAAGADVVVGSHAHQPQGAGMLGDTYVG